MKKIVPIILIFLLVQPPPGFALKQAITEVGTPRNETLIFQTFDRQTPYPDRHNPLMDYAVWRGFRELGWGALWELDTGTGEFYPELASEMPIPLNDEFTSFEVRLKKGIYWSDGVEFTADDLVYTLDVYNRIKNKSSIGHIGRIANYIAGYRKTGPYRVTIDTTNSAYDFHEVMGVRFWGPRFIIVPKHIFEKQPNLTTFRNTYPVTLGPYTVKKFDPEGYWQLWELRKDWKRSAWGGMDEDGFMPKYVLYKDFGPEEARVPAFVGNEYDADTFMSPDSIRVARQQNNHIETFSPHPPYHNMDDACSYGVLMNLQKAPLNLPEVRWALALSLDLKKAAINAQRGELKVSPLPLVDSRILRPAYFEPLLPWLREFQLEDGYKPFDANFVSNLSDMLREFGLDVPESRKTKEELSHLFGIGWWKYDVNEAESLLKSVGFTKSEGSWQLPGGGDWVLELVIPGDWNKVMQRLGFAIADSWRQAGITVDVRQVDWRTYRSVENNNAEREVLLSWRGRACFFTPNFLLGYHSIRPENVRPGDSTQNNQGNNIYQWNSNTVDNLLDQATRLETASTTFKAVGRRIIQEFITDMAYINLMNIPTTIPTNSYYWTGWPKQDNYYAVPFTWWSSIKKTIINIRPTGR